MKDRRTMMHNQREFNGLRYVLAKLIRSEERFSFDAHLAVKVIDDILSKNVLFEFNEEDVNLLTKVRNAFYNISQNKDIWQKIADLKLNIDVLDEADIYSVIEPIDKISKFFIDINICLQTNAEPAFNIRLQNCIYLSNAYKLLLDLLAAKPNLKTFINHYLETFNMNAESLFITPTQSVARWALLMNKLKKKFDDGLTVYEHRKKISIKRDFFKTDADPSTVEMALASLRRKFARQTLNLNTCQETLLEIGIPVQQLPVISRSSSRVNQEEDSVEINEYKEVTDGEIDKIMSQPAYVKKLKDICGRTITHAELILEPIGKPHSIETQVANEIKNTSSFLINSRTEGITNYDGIVNIFKFVKHTDQQAPEKKDSSNKEEDVYEDPANQYRSLLSGNFFQNTNRLRRDNWIKASGFQDQIKNIEQTIERLKGEWINGSKKANEVHQALERAISFAINNNNFFKDHENEDQNFEDFLTYQENGNKSIQQALDIKRMEIFCLITPASSKLFKR